MIGRKLSHYRIVEQVGAGGMGEVYLAEDTRLGRRVALKVLPADLARDPDRLERFQREARALAALDHPNIVTLHSVEEVEGVHFLTMAYAEGDPLGDLIPANGLPVSTFLDLAVPLVDAVRAAHDRGIVHRDLKASNVMVDREGRLRVLDFGLARLVGAPESADLSRLPTEAMTRAGAIVGTFPYMSPEQAEGREVDERSDIFSLGVLLHEMATGERPFGGATAASLVAAILREAPRSVDEVRADLPRDLGRVVRRCLEKDPARRYQRAADLLHDLQALRREALGEGRAPSETAKPPARRRALAWSAGLVTVLGAAVAVLVWSLGRPPETAPDPGSIRSIAVLPLTNLMNDPDQDYFVDGMTEALIADLAKLGDLDVISRTSVMRYKGTEKSVPEIARELAVDALLEGSVLRAGDKVRITVQLIDGTSDTHVWAEAYDRPFTDILALHSEVARSIAGEIEVQVTPREQALLAADRVDPEAYEAYLRGKFHLDRVTPEGLRRAQPFLERALELDPNLAPAHVAIARLHGNTAFVGLAPPTERMPLARRALLRALELDETSAEAHTVLAHLHLSYDRDFAAGKRELDRALELDPSNAGAHQLASGYYMTVGQTDRALAEVRTALRLDPFSPGPALGEARLLLDLGREEEAERSIRRTLQRIPESPFPHGILAFVLIRQGRKAEGIQEFREYYRRIGLPDIAEAIEEGFQATGVEGAFGRAAERLEALAEERYVSPMEIAAAHALAGRRDEAFGWLERAAGTRDPLLWQLKIDPTFEALRSDPRFDELTRRLGLPGATGRIPVG